MKKNTSSVLILVVMEVDCIFGNMQRPGSQIDVLILVVMEVDCILCYRLGVGDAYEVLILVVMEVDCIEAKIKVFNKVNRLNPCCDGSRLYNYEVNSLCSSNLS